MATRLVTKKSEVMNSALFLFMRNGINATTTRDIALKAGVSEGTIYRHFQSKEHLAESVFESSLHLFWNFLRKYLKNCQNAEAMLAAFVEGIFEFSQRYQKRYRFIIAAHQTELRKQSRERLKPKNMLEKIIRLGQSQQLFREIDPKLASAMVLGIIVQTIFYQKSGSIPVKHDQVVAEVAASCLQIVKATSS